MKRWICTLVALALLAVSAFAEMPYESVRIEFEDGFALSLPADWVSYEVPEDLNDQGFLYCLGSADGARLMYIQRWSSDCADLAALQAELEQQDEIVLRSSLESVSGTPFLMYNFADTDCSGCLTLLDGDVLNLLFLPQSDDSTMLIAANVMGSYDALN